MPKPLVSPVKLVPLDDEPTRDAEVPPTTKNFDKLCTHTAFTNVFDPTHAAVAADHVLKLVFTSDAIVPLTPRFISVGLVMLADSTAPSLITRIFFVDPAAVAALAYVSFGAPSEVPALPVVAGRGVKVDDVGI